MDAGSPCVLATFAFSPLVGGGVMAVVFPLVSILVRIVWLSALETQAGAILNIGQIYMEYIRMV